MKVGSKQNETLAQSRSCRRIQSRMKVWIGNGHEVRKRIFGEMVSVW
ncbi:MAG: hypothetical protein J6A23_07740 [Thermoguttaceae bacterium]|nr:hypothetical protein [Thermoguttaceae bacterium]MBP3694147.1 hypothetical protein [Thermoguttaceae bacterium]